MLLLLHTPGFGSHNLPTYITLVVKRVPGTSYGTPRAFAWQTDSTICPPPKKKQRFCSMNAPCLLDTRKDAMKKYLHTFFLFAKDYRTMTSGGHPFFTETVVGFKTGEFVKGILGGLP